MPALGENETIAVDREKYDSVLKALNPRTPFVDREQAQAVDAALFEQRKKYRLDDVYTGFSYLYKAEMHALSKKSVQVSPISPEEEYRVKKLIDQIALAANRHLLLQYPEDVKRQELLTDAALVYALEELQKTIGNGNDEESARIKGEIIGMAVLGGISRERPSDLLVLNQYFKYLRKDIANPLQDILNENRKEVTIGKFTGKIGEDFRGLEVNLPERVVNAWKELTIYHRAGWLGLVAADLTWVLIQWKVADSAHFDKNVRGLLGRIGVFMASHPPDQVNHYYRRSVLEEYVIGARMYARQFRDLLEKAVPGITKLPFIPESEPNPLIRRHGYIPQYCRELFAN